MTQRLDNVKTDKVRDSNLKLVANGPEAQNENKHSSPDKIGHLHGPFQICVLFFFMLMPKS